MPSQNGVLERSFAAKLTVGESIIHKTLAEVMTTVIRGRTESGQAPQPADEHNANTISFTRSMGYTLLTAISFSPAYRGDVYQRRPTICAQSPEADVKPAANTVEK